MFDDEMGSVMNVKELIVTQVFTNVGTTKSMNTILGIVGITTLNWWRFPLTQSMRCYLRSLAVRAHVHLKNVVKHMDIGN